MGVDAYTGNERPFSFLQKYAAYFAAAEYNFQVANCMIANFYNPYSTMLMLTAAFGGYELIMDAYNEALKQDYRFGIYGDAMLIID